jgi:hypothetical protein
MNARAPRPSSGALVRIARGLRALMALLMLVALLAGLPWLLWHATAAAADSGIEDLQHLFSRSDTSGAFFLAPAA